MPSSWVSVFLAKIAKKELQTQRIPIISSERIPIESMGELFRNVGNITVVRQCTPGKIDRGKRFKFFFFIFRIKYGDTI